VAKYIWLKCLDCSEEVEVYCDGDNAMMCPECRSIDNFEEVEQNDSNTTKTQGKIQVLNR